jgi:hypothetical protein
VTQLSLSLDPSPLSPPLEERVRVLSLWQPYASLVIAGVKTLETRKWEWPYQPSWLVIHVAKRAPSPADEKRLADLRAWADGEAQRHERVGAHGVGGFYREMLRRIDRKD